MFGYVNCHGYLYGIIKTGRTRFELATAWYLPTDCSEISDALSTLTLLKSQALYQAELPAQEHKSALAGRSSEFHHENSFWTRVEAFHSTLTNLFQWAFRPLFDATLPKLPTGLHARPSYTTRAPLYDIILSTIRFIYVENSLPFSDKNSGLFIKISLYSSILPENHVENHIKRNKNQNKM